MNIPFGATLNLAHPLSQMLYCRHRNEFNEIDNLVGSGTLGAAPSTNPAASPPTSSPATA